MPRTCAILVRHHQTTSKSVDDRSLVRNDGHVPQLVVHLGGAGDDPRRLVRFVVAASRQTVGWVAAGGVGVVKETQVEEITVVEVVLTQHVLGSRPNLAPVTHGTYRVANWYQSAYRLTCF